MEAMTRLSAPATPHLTAYAQAAGMTPAEALTFMTAEQAGWQGTCFMVSNGVKVAAGRDPEDHCMKQLPPAEPVSRVAPEYDFWVTDGLTGKRQATAIETAAGFFGALSSDPYPGLF